MTTKDRFRSKLKLRGADNVAIDNFIRAYELLKNGTDFSMPEAMISPASKVPEMEEILPKGKVNYADYLKQTVAIKLNGGLGTGMGLKTAKSLLKVKEGQTFLDLIAKQNASLRQEHGEAVKFLLMNSFSTSHDTNAYLSKYPEYSNSEEVEFLQNISPKITKESLEPVNWEREPQLEWCPPGHGDIYTALYGSGWLDKLLNQGIKYAFISNSDNLGAFINPALLAYFAKTEIPFLMEVTRRTQSDSKGGHLAVRTSDQQLVLREVAQCPEKDLQDFQDITKHEFFNTNNLWLRLDALKEVMEKENGVMPLPVITNEKTVDPRDSNSPKVYQLETAMGAAIESFRGASAVCVPRRRFAPVKTTADLLSLRSDAYEIHTNGRVMLIPERQGNPPIVKLSKHYKFVDALEKLGIPSLKKAKSLTVEGYVNFHRGVSIKGDVTFVNPTNEVMEIPSGIYENVSLVHEKRKIAC